jgi:hypothetical protein
VSKQEIAENDVLSAVRLFFSSPSQTNPTEYYAFAGRRMGRTLVCASWPRRRQQENAGEIAKPLRRNVAEYRSNSIPRLVNGLERLQAIHLSPHVCTKFRVLVEFETL